MTDESRRATQWLHQALGLKGEDTPFPWQTSLLDDFRRGKLHSAVDIPTGLGKTSVMAIWLVARALGAPVPRRLVYIVDRRAVVDQATEVALRLRDFIEQTSEVKERLGISGRPLPVSTLRGQYVDNREWLEDPTSPAIMVGTVDMIGSRLLFQGYGVSRKMRPYHAGLLGADTLAVLDEAHLVPPFEHLLRTVATEPVFRPRDERCDQCVPRFQLVTLSATGRTQDEHIVGLTQKDFEHDVLKKRLTARKSVWLKPLDENIKLHENLANHAWQLTDNGKQAARVIVYSYSREVAQNAKRTLEKLAKGDKEAGVPSVEVETELLVGGRRIFEREHAKKRLEDLGFLAGSKVERSRPVFLFATSAGEVGIDLDADHMTCDLVAWDWMVQRFGRVNRRGEPESHTANIVVLVEREPKADKKVREALDKQQRNELLDEKERGRVEGYEKKFRELKNRQKPFELLPKMNNRCWDVSLDALIELKTLAQTDPERQKVLADATSLEPLRPALTVPLVEAWSLTSLKKHPGRPAVQPWLRGWVADEPQTVVVWRTYLPVRKGGQPPRKSGIEAFFEAAPPHTSELLETETSLVVKWIAARANHAFNKKTEQEGTDGSALHEDDVVAFALDPDGTLRKSLTLREVKAPGDKQGFQKLIEDATLILDARLGGLKEKDGLLDDSVSDPPPTADGSAWLGEGVAGFRIRHIEASGTVTIDRNWRERFRFACEVSEDGEPIQWLVVDKWRNDAATEDDRSEGAPQLLEKHQERAEQRARELAKALSLSQEDESVLALAARLHDEGKRAVRWQRAFNAPKDGAYAKTEGPINQSLLDGYRHEFGSLLRIENDERLQDLSEEQRDLVLHVIAAHHGFARPGMGTNGCEDAPPSVLEDKAAEITLRFARLQVRWGAWGLAWWEALLRAADQLASRENVGSSTAGGCA